MEPLDDIPDWIADRTPSDGVAGIKAFGGDNLTGKVVDVHRLTGCDPEHVIALDRIASGLVLCAAVPVRFRGA